ncbi:hypothetical protein [Mucilaginibacter sp. UYCu711]|uniref:hypothetical protein n=1 Tax=Mucilaginibacter sp. UYCu711 TaxID=3156339 RepID=UPI003D1C33A7
MNKLLHQLSWEAYLQIAFLILTACYVIIAVKFFRDDFVTIYQRLTGQITSNDGLPAALQYQAEEHVQPAISDHAIQVKPDLISDTGALAVLLAKCIQAAVGKPFASAILIPQLKKILNDYPEIAASSDRELIIDFIIQQCERTGTALLSESEVDLWWSA